MVDMHISDYYFKGENAMNTNDFQTNVPEPIANLPNIYQFFHQEDHVYSTFILGEESGLLIDTGFGEYSLDECIRKITNKPYEVLNTHGHPDHILGNGEFSSVWLNKLDESIAKKYAEKKIFNYKWLKEGQCFDLGNLRLKVVLLPGHTAGSIGLLWEEERLLIAGDALNPTLWLFLDECSSLSDYRKTVEYAKTLPFDHYLFAHHNEPLPKAFLDVILKNIDTLKLDETTKETILDYETYQSVYRENGMESRIVYARKTLL